MIVKERKDIVKEIKMKAKRANQRLREIEKRGLTNSSVAYNDVQQLQFDNKNYMTFTDKGEIKFNTALTNRDDSELKEELRKLDKFLNAKTSTKSGIERAFKNQYESYIEKYPEQNLSFDEFNSIYSSSLIKSFLDIYQSDELTNILDNTISNSIEDIERVLRNVGFTGKEEIPLKKIKEEFEKQKKLITDEDIYEGIL